MLALNAEVFRRLSEAADESEMVPGVPHGIACLAIPQVRHRFALDFPKMPVRLHSSFSRVLKVQVARGDCGVILTTDAAMTPGGETLLELPLHWIGAPGGSASWQRSLYEHHCSFQQGQQVLERAEIRWKMAGESDNTRSSEAPVSADLAVHPVRAGSEPPHVERMAHRGSLPDPVVMP